MLQMKEKMSKWRPLATVVEGRAASQVSIMGGRGRGAKFAGPGAPFISGTGGSIVYAFQAVGKVWHKFTSPTL